MRILLPLFLVLIIFTSCGEDDKTGDNPGPVAENTVMRLSLVYDGEKLPTDSIMNNLGQTFFIEDVTLVFSDFYFREGADTSVYRRESFVLSSSKTDNSVVIMPPGGYSGSYGLRFGLDSAASMDIALGGIPSDSELRDADVLRASGDGIDHAIITGRVFDTSDPTDSVGNISLSYRLGTEALNRLKTSLQKNFSVQGDRIVSVVVQVDLGPVFSDLDMVARPIVVTDPQNLVDYNLAIQMANNLKIELF